MRAAMYEQGPMKDDFHVPYAFRCIWIKLTHQRNHAVDVGNEFRALLLIFFPDSIRMEVKRQTMSSAHVSTE